MTDVSGPVLAPIPLGHRTLAESLLMQLTRQIVTGALPPGSSLPTERALQDAFGVGRTTVREALQRLQAGGFVDRVGKRLVVRGRADLPVTGLAAAAASAEASIRDAFEARKLLEVEAARLAAERRDDEDLKLLREVLTAMGAVGEVEFHRVNQQFHLLIAQMSGNKVLAEVYENSLPLFFRSQAYWQVFEAAGLVERPLAGGGQAGHQRIFDAIAAGSAAEAAQAMGEYLDRVRDALVDRVRGGTPGEAAAPG